jgi:ubiquinone biosynthesis protein Coq4
VTRIVLVALVAAVAVVATGCGKSSKPLSASDWASSFCSDVTTWRDSVTSAASPLKNGNITKDTVQTAFNDFKSATDTFVSDVKKLGKPATQDGGQAKQAVDQLSTQIDDGVNTIKSAVSGVSDVSSALAAASTVSGTLTSMRTDVKTTYSNLQQIDASGELTSAFADSASCKALKTG